ncbi:MAG: hypothetical protein ACM3SQ_04240 [Betaproteobacteria bacterium]
MIQRPVDIGRFEFVALASLRAAQLLRGCRPRVDGAHKATVTAQMEVAERKVAHLASDPEAIPGAAIPPASIEPAIV